MSTPPNGSRDRPCESFRCIAGIAALRARSSFALRRTGRGRRSRELVHARRLVSTASDVFHVAASLDDHPLRGQLVHAIAQTPEKRPLPTTKNPHPPDS